LAFASHQEAVWTGPNEVGVLTQLDTLLSQTEQPGVKARAMKVEVVAPVGLLVSAVEVTDVHGLRLRVHAHVIWQLQAKPSERELGAMCQETAAASLGPGCRAVEE